MFRNKKLLKKSVGLVTLRFELYTNNTRLIELLYISMEAWLGVTMTK